MFNTRGTLSLTNNRLIPEGEDGQVTYALSRLDGKRYDGPTEVRIQTGLVDVDGINSAAQSFVANCYMESPWWNQRLAHDETDTLVRPLEVV
jgi:hypothetical protein